MHELGKTPEALAEELGFANSNVVGFILQGKIKLSYNQVKTLASALNTDATHLLRLVLRDSYPDLLKAIEHVLERPLLSARETALINSFRAITKDSDAPGLVMERDGMLELIMLHEA